MKNETNTMNMILVRNIDIYPLEFNKKFPHYDINRVKCIGYWAPSGYALEKGFFDKEALFYPNPANFVDSDWDPEEKEIIAEYLDNGQDIEYWMGYSYCRFGCNELPPGTTDKSDGEWVWPSGFSHYIRVHNVKPPAEFVQKVLKINENLSDREKQIKQAAKNVSKVVPFQSD